MLNEHDDTLRAWARIINFQKPTGHCRIWRQSECGKCFFGRSRPSKFPKKKKKDSHKLVWPSNYINIRLGWEFLKTIWVGKSFLGRRPYNLTCMLFELLTTCTKETIVVEFLDSFEFLWNFKGKNFVSSRNNFVKVLFRFLCGWVFFQNIGVRG